MKKFKVGLQLYSLRDEMDKDMDKTLKAVKEIGYDYVEFAGYFGKTAEEVKAILDKYELKAISVHQRYEVFLENEVQNIEYIKKLGVEYCAIPWMGIEKHAGSDLFEQTVSEITQVATALKENGIQMLYHNHDFEFKTYQGKFLLDRLYEAVPADLLQTEIDTCWVKYSGNEPVEYMKKYKGRSNLLHLKDFVCDSIAKGPAYALIDEAGKDTKKAADRGNGFEFRPLGQGVQDFESILRAAEEIGIEYLIVEQDECRTASPLESVKQSYEYLKTLGQ